MKHIHLLALIAIVTAVAAENLFKGFEVSEENAEKLGEEEGGLKLNPDLVQKASTQDGFIEGEKNIARSLTSNDNFSNFCAGKKLTDGKQVEEGSCNGIVMGDIPSKGRMVSTIILFPKTGGEPIKADETFKIEIQTANLVAGVFTNPETTYYSAPQQLKDGKIIGHVHVTVQSLGDNLNPNKPLDTTQFVFFKGINDNGDGKGRLSATVDKGLPAGFYRVCTLGSSSNHQGFILPVAQRGSADDCTKFEVSDKGKSKDDNQSQESNEDKGKDKDDDDDNDNDDDDDEDEDIEGDDDEDDNKDKIKRGIRSANLRRGWRLEDFIS